MNILIVEDNSSHLTLTEHVLRRNNTDANLFVVRDGQEVLDFLYRKELYVNPVVSPTPDLILLDLNLPKRDGREVLKVLKNDPALKDIPVVIVSTSDREEDIAYAFENGAAAYISKSIGFERFTQEMSEVRRYARTS